MVSSFETLPDEILMIIVRYSGNAYAIFQAFSGLNQRLNNILVDRRLYLLAQLLYAEIDDPGINYYYNSDSFRAVRQQFSSLKITKGDNQLHRFLRSLITSYLQEEYKRLGCVFQSSIEQFESTRARLTAAEMNTLDKELKRTFDYLPVDLCPQDPYCAWEPHFFPESIANLKQIESYVLIQGARLDCDNDDEMEFNFTKAINKWLLAKANLTRSSDRRLIHPLIQMFKALLISNPMLLKNRGYTQYDTPSRCTHYFLLYSIYRLRYFHDSSRARQNPIKMHWYKAVLDLFLFVIHSLKHIFDDEFRLKGIVRDILSMINWTEPATHSEIFIHTSQLEILKIMLHEYDLEHVAPCDEHETFSQLVCDLIKSEQLNTIRFVYSNSLYVQSLFHKVKTSEQIVDTMTGSRKGRQMLRILLGDAPLATWLTSSDLLFMLLRKKECKLIKRLLNVSPSLVHRLDEDGNDALLYVCLKVRGCRHRLVELLIEAGCDLQRRNSQVEDFKDALQLTRNRKLLEKLIEHEIIQVADASGEIQAIHSKNAISKVR